MKDISIKLNKFTELQPLFLSLEEEETKKKQYKKIIRKYYPKVENIDQNDYIRLKHNKDYEKLMLVALKYAHEQLIKVYLHYDIIGYNFEDFLQELYINTNKRFKQCLIADYLYEFKFFIRNITTNYVFNKMSNLARKNLDISYTLNDKLKKESDVDETVVERENLNEREYLMLDFKKNVKKYIENISPKYQELLTLYYGLNGTSALTMTEIAEHYKISKSAIQQHMAQALKILSSIENKEDINDYKDGFEF